MNCRPVSMGLTFLFIGLLTLTACSRSPRPFYYTLVPLSENEAAMTAKYSPTVTVASITLPELVDRPQLVVRADGSQVDILEMHRWAEPLKSSISSLLAENISRTLGIERVSTYLQSASFDADFRLFVDIQRFESGSDWVAVDALWTLRRLQEAKPVTGRSKIRESFTEKSYEGMVDAYSRAITKLSKDIAESIRTATKTGL